MCAIREMLLTFVYGYSFLLCKGFRWEVCRNMTPVCTCKSWAMDTAEQKQYRSAAMVSFCGLQCQQVCIAITELKPKI